MYPVVFRIGSFEVTSFGLLVAIGAMVGLWLFRRELLKSRLRNYSKMWERRIVFTIGITYETPRDRVREVPGIIERAIRSQDKTRFDRAHFASFGDFALVFEAVYYVLDKDYGPYMDIQQAVNLQIVEEFGRRGIAFAYPTNRQFSINLPAPGGPASGPPPG